MGEGAAVLSLSTAGIVVVKALHSMQKAVTHCMLLVLLTVNLDEEI